MDKVSETIEEVIQKLQRLLLVLAPEKTLPTVIIDAIATTASTRGHQEDLWAMAVASLKAGTPAEVIADAIYRGELSDDGE